MSFKSKSLMLLASAPARLLPDEFYIKAKFRLLMGYWPDLKHPVTYNEKLNWLKLHDRNPLYHTLADKAAVKEYVASVCPEVGIVPTLGVWNSTKEIPWDKLPKRFVLKCTHDSGSTVLVTEETDRSKAEAKLRSAMKVNFYKFDREWVYKGLTPRIIAEEYLGANVPDYKFFCFNGRPRVMYIVSDRYRRDVEVQYEFFDMDGVHLDVRNVHPNAPVPPSLPKNFARMQQLAAKLSAGIPCVRIDFYERGDEVFFGEYTFYHNAGLVPFTPASFDALMGSYIE